MPFAVTFLDDGRVLEWTLTDDGAAVAERDDYAPRFHVAARDPAADVDLAAVRRRYDGHPDVVDTSFVRRRPGFRRERERVLAVDAAHVDRVRPLARLARGFDAAPVGDLACFDVDLTPGFRYHLATDTDPTPARRPRTLRLAVPGPDAGGPYERLSVDGEVVAGDPERVVAAVERAVAERDPDVLVCSTAEVVPTLHEMAADADRAGFTLSRWDGLDYRRLAGASTYESYGRVGHSPARYAVPGRAIVDESNTFFYAETNLDGLLDLVERSRKPLQELSWASIGNVLTAIQIREARRRGVLTPWNAWRRERFKTARRLHDADRGGFTFAPEVGVHEDVHELDFASLYPNVIRTRNVSPETVRCDCHRDRADVPGLGYAICDERGYLPDVLDPLVAAREDLKAEIASERASADPDDDRIAALEGRSSALKWILVACFGYQGFSNAKFGRIECHEAINAYAREILLTAKERLEAGGWRVLHGIVDSIWVTPDPEVPDARRVPLDDLAGEVSAAVEIRLEYEAAYDWVAFIPRREGAGGALTKYFGATADGDLKLRGVAARRRSTPPLVADVQRECVERFAQSRAPGPVLARLRRALARLHAGEVPAADLTITKRVSKPREAYDRATRTVAALERAADRGVAVGPGRDVSYVVVDDDRSDRDRVALAWEAPETYDADHYRRLLVRAVADVLAPLGWDADDVRAALRGDDQATLERW